MNLRQRLSAGNLLLLELILALVFFSLTMAATMSVFGRAYEMSKDAAGIDMALAQSNSAIEIIRSVDRSEEIRNILTGNGFSNPEEGRYEKGYGDGRYNMELILSKEGNLITADISCLDNEDRADTAEPLYEISIKHAVKGDR
ncbi:MAG: hypothetical protein K6A90_11440 [Lachnospiraceae bacterium]|nr:hypothetical protein [Lachnospiraceae bacterium]